MKNLFSKNVDIIIVSLILAALLLIVFKDVVFSDYVFVKRDISRYYYPLRNFVADTFRKGEIPLWNPYLFCGTPLHAPIQNSIFYPLSLIYYLMDTARGFSLFIILHIFLCGLFMYLFMKSWGVSKQGSFLAAFMFTFSGYIMSAVSLTISLNSVAWFPLAMLVFLKGLKKCDYKFSISLGAVLTLMFLAGDPSIVISTFGVIFLASGYLFIERLIRERQLANFIIFNFLVTSAVFFLLSAFQSIPAVEYYTRTVRVDMGWGEASVWSMPYSDFFSLIIPYFSDLSIYYQDYWIRQSWLDNYYVGITTILLSGFALRFGIKKKLVQFLIAIGLISIAVCLGRHFIIYPLLYKAIPIVRIIRYPVRFFFIFTFSVCALAGIGYDHLKQMMTSGRLKRLAKVFLITAFLASLLVIIVTAFSEKIAIPIMKKATEIYRADSSFNIWDFPSLIYADIFNLRRTLLYISCFGLFIFLWSKTKKITLMSFALFLLVGFDLILTNTGYEPIEKRTYFKEPTENIRYVMKDKSFFRILASPYSLHMFTKLYEKSYHMGIKSSKDRFVNNRMMEFGLYDMWGYDSTVLKRNLELVEHIYKSKGPTDTNLLNLLNVKYVSSHSNMRAPGYKKVNQTPNAAVYLNSRCLPRALLLKEAIVIDKDEDILKYMASKKFNPEKEIILEERIDLPKGRFEPRKPFRKDKIDEQSGSFFDFPTAILKERSDEGSHEILQPSGLQDDPSGDNKQKNSPRGQIDIIKYTPQIVEISVATKEPAFLLLSDTYYPGWKAYIDGRVEKIYRADYFLRAIKMPEGEHLVRFVYAPLSFKIGAAVSIVSLLGLSLYLVVDAIFYKKQVS